MATTTDQSFQDELREDQRRLSSAVEDTWGISVATYKAIKWTVQGIGVTGGVYALVELDAAPILTLIIMLMMIHGPETLEYLLVNGGDG